MEPPTARALARAASALEVGQPTRLLVQDFLITLRRRLEHRDLKRRFPLLNLYANWSVHYALGTSKEPQQILAEVGRRLRAATHPTAGVGETVAFQRAILQALSPARLRRELQEFLSSEGLPTRLCESRSRWLRMHCLFECIGEYPLQLKLFSDEVRERDLEHRGGWPDTAEDDIDRLYVKQQADTNGVLTWCWVVQWAPRVMIQGAMVLDEPASAFSVP